MLETADRRAYVLEYRRGGMKYRDIAAKMERQFGDRLPKGWDERYAYKDVKRSLEAIKQDISEDAAAVRTMELERLDSLLLALWPRAIAGDYKAVDRVLKIMERRARYLGLDSADVLDLNIKTIEHIEAVPPDDLAPPAGDDS
jgi:hypothetical protein